MSDTEKRIIVIGSEGHSGVENVEWAAENMPNIADYDNVVVDTYSLSTLLRKTPKKREHTKKNEDFLRKIKKNQEFVRERLIHLLHSKGNVYVICSPREFREISTYSSCDNYDWSPFSITMTNEPGETKNVIDDSFSHYFQFVKKWSFYFEKPSSLTKIAEFYENQYYIETKWEAIAENRYIKPLAIAIYYGLHRFKNEAELRLDRTLNVLSMDIPRYRDEVEDVSGKLFLLPTPSEIDTKEAINIILEDIWGIQQKTPPPEGIEEILLPGEAELKQEIKEKLDKIGELNAEVSDLVARKDKLTQFKQMLYETGKPLEEICKLTFSKLGYEVDDSVEDFILLIGDKEAIVEVKGREGSILRQDGSQLAQNRRNYAINKERDINEVKPILLGNPWRLKFPLEARLKQQLFAPHLVGDAKNERMALVTTVELFKAYYAFLEGKNSKEEIVKQLLSGIGSTKLIEE